MKILLIVISVMLVGSGIVVGLRWLIESRVLASPTDVSPIDPDLVFAVVWGGAWLTAIWFGIRQERRKQ